jgi:hypothetical protein
MSRPPADPTWTSTKTGLATLVGRLTPWLLSLGDWVFGGLIAFNLLTLSALLTVGPVDTPVLIATAAVALALPPGVAGFLLLRLAADMKSQDLEEVASEAFVEAGFEVDESGPAENPKAAERRRSFVVLRYSSLLMALTVVFSLVGVTAALWHMAWWIGSAFVAMALVSLAVFLVAVVSTGRGDTTWTTPTGETEGEQT